MPVMLALVALLTQSGPPTAPAEALFDAARAGDRARVAALLDAGVAVDSKARYDASPLMFAADKGHLDVVTLLVDRGADVNAQDTFYHFRAIDLALMNGHDDIARYLLGKGSNGAASALMEGIRQKDVALVKAALAGPDMDATTLARALTVAGNSGNTEIDALVRSAALARPIVAPTAIQVAPEKLQSYVGQYELNGGIFTVAMTNGQLTVAFPGQPPSPLVPTAEDTFAVPQVSNATVVFAGRGGLIESMQLARPTGTAVLSRVTADARNTGTETAARPASAGSAASSSANTLPAAAAKPANWPAFRGLNAAGDADGQGAVVEWEVASGKNILWKTPVPGLSVSSPVVWSDRVIVTTAVGSASGQKLRTGLYGDVAPVEDLSPHQWKIIAVDLKSGKVVWERTVVEGVPQVKRHPKSSQASSTPVTDGHHIVAAFGSVGLLVCYDMDGKQLWKIELGVVNSGWFFDPTYQWGHGSSPIIYGDSVIVQVDQQRGSYLAAYALETGRQQWQTPRPDEISTWGTPSIVRGPRGDELVTNGTKVRAYDPRTGKLLWTLGPNSEITIATPVVGDGVVYVTGGYPPVRPIYAIRPGGSGDISLPRNKTSDASIAWSNDREGTYIPTPILYHDRLYTLNNNGVLTAYNPATGDRLYRARVGNGAAFSASPVAADGRLFMASEDGDVYVASIRTEYTELAKNAMNEPIIATPAISNGVIVVRTAGYLYGIGRH